MAYGVQLYRHWKTEHPDPTISELVARYEEVATGLMKRREKNKAYPAGWLYELGLVDFCQRSDSYAYNGLRDWEIPAHGES